MAIVLKSTIPVPEPVDVELPELVPPPVSSVAWRRHFAVPFISMVATMSGHHARYIERRAARDDRLAAPAHRPAVQFSADAIVTSPLAPMPPGDCKKTGPCHFCERPPLTVLSIPICPVLATCR